MDSSPSTTGTGLTTAEAAAKLHEFGGNIVTARKKFRPIVAFVKKFNSPLLWILMAAALISVFVGQRTSAVILVFMVLLSVFLDFVNTYRSEKAVNGLVAKVVTTIAVFRDGATVDLPAAMLVPGDVVHLTAGNIVPADGMIIDSKDLYVNQSVMTGESLPVEKQHDAAVDAAAPLTADRADVLFMGTSVVSGFARMEILRTGRRTEFGKIAQRLEAEEQRSDFERSIRQFSVFLIRVTAVMVSFVFLANLFAHRGVFDSFLFAVAIAIGLTPELLPVIIAVSLSRGAVRMSKQDVVVKHLPAIHHFGRMDVFCTDKTGTLTENRITVVRYLDGFGAVSEEVLRTAYWNSAFHTGVVNPLDRAIVDFRTWDLGGIEKVDEVPFDFERRRESIVVARGAERIIVTKGAPETVFPICQKYRQDGVDHVVDERFWHTAQEQFAALSRDGYKVLAVAARQVEPSRRAFEPSDERAMTFLGFVALLDPPNASASQAIADLEQLGIEVKILTGDSAILTERICRDLALPTKGTITGDELRSLPLNKWHTMVREHTIFARIDPEQKERIIRALRANGSVVGFLGDGINDAPALKAADVGISVNNAVDVAKETADIILLRHSLRVLKDGVVEGRRTFHNTMKYIDMGLSSNFGNMFSMMIASGFLPFLPMLPTQILLNNFLYDTSQLSLSTDKVDEEDVRKPTVWDIRAIRRFMLTFGPVSSLFDFATFGLLWVFFHSEAAKFQAGWFMESIATQVLVIYVIRTRKVPLFQSRPSLFLVINTILAVLIAWSIPYLPLGRLFGFSPLPLPVLAIIVGYVIAYLFLVEGVKRWHYRRQRALDRKHLEAVSV